MGMIHWRIWAVDSSSGGRGWTSNVGFLLVSRALFCINKSYSLIASSRQPYCFSVYRIGDLRLKCFLWVRLDVGTKQTKIIQMFYSQGTTCLIEVE